MKEIEKIIEYNKLGCTVKTFLDNVNGVQRSVSWYIISRYQKLSESFIEKFQHKVSWGWISACQSLSESFIEKFQDKWDWYYLLNYNENIPEEKIKEPHIGYYWRICNNINLYNNTEKNKRYLFLKNKDYLEKENYLITFN